MLTNQLSQNHRVVDLLELALTSQPETPPLQEEELQSIISQYAAVNQVLECSVSVIVPTAVEGVSPVAEMMAVQALMSQMHPPFEGEVSVFPILTMHKNGREFCKRNLIVKAWMKPQVLRERISDVLEYARLAGRSLRQEVITVLVDSRTEKLMVLVNCQ